MVVPIVLVTIQGASPDIPRDIEKANEMWGGACELWVDVIATIEVDRPDLLAFDQDDCFGGSAHSVSAEEDELFSIGRGLGPDVVCYYVKSGMAGARGCAAHPPDRPGFWVSDSATDWTFIHELTHVVGSNPHVADSDNLMYGGGTGSITNLPPDLDQGQCENILQDPAQLSIESIVLNL
jgi:hypothetical protein